jgi:hypothetical protein
MIVCENSGYKLQVEVRHLDIPPNAKYVRIFTTYDWAKDPEVEQNKMELILSEDEVAAFIKALTD